MTFPVFIMTADVQSPGAQLLVDRFSSGIFDVHIASIEASRAVDRKNAEWIRAMTMFEAMPHNQGLVIVKDSSVTTCEPDTIARTVKAASERYDLFHMCRWDEDCSSIRNVVSIPNSSVAMSTTKPPDGVQAIYMSRKAVDILHGDTHLRNGDVFVHHPERTLADELRTLVDAGELTSGAPVSNLFSYNVLAAKTSRDLRKTNECLMSGSFTTPKPEEPEDDDFPVSMAAPMATDDDAPLTESALAPPPKSGTIDFFKRCRVGWVILLVIAFLLLVGLLLYLLSKKN